MNKTICAIGDIKRKKEGEREDRTENRALWNGSSSGCDKRPSSAYLDEITAVGKLN